MGGLLVIGFQARVETGRGMVAGQHVVIGRSVSGIAVSEGPDDRELVHLASQFWQVLADLDAGHVGGDRVERTAELLGSIRFHVPGVDRAQPAGKKQDDQRRVVSRDGFLGLPIF